MEVMVAVLIVSVVIAALLQMRGDTSQKFFSLQKMMQTNQYSSFLLGVSDKYGFDSSQMDMKRLVDEFELESDLRWRLKSLKTEIKYKELTTIDTSEMSDTQDSNESASTGFVFEIGKSIIKTKESSGQLIRVRLQ